MLLHQFWRRITTTRYARSLEIELVRRDAEILRLRDENRALLNSILGIAGIPPVPVNATEGPDVAPACPEHSRREPLYPEERRAAQRSSSTTPAALKTAALHSNLAQRRRSWHQVNQILELDSARKPVASD